jgi:hypothetical protein
MSEYEEYVEYMGKLLEGRYRLIHTPFIHDRRPGFSSRKEGFNSHFISILSGVLVLRQAYGVFLFLVVSLQLYLASFR